MIASFCKKIERAEEKERKLVREINSQYLLSFKSLELLEKNMPLLFEKATKELNEDIEKRFKVLESRIEEVQVAVLRKNEQIHHEIAYISDFFNVFL